MDYSSAISTPLTESSPCGENLDDDNLFYNFLLSSEGTQERSRGDDIIPASPPDWRVIKKDAEVFLKSTKHLWLISVFAQSVLNLEGVASFASCLKGLATLLEEQWDFVYPLVDHDADSSIEKVMERISALSHLTHDKFVIDTLKDIPLARNKVTGPISLRIIFACANSTADAKPEFDHGQISLIFRDDNQETLKELLENLVSCQNSLCRIQNSFSSFDALLGVDFTTLSKILQAMIGSLEKYGNLSTKEQKDVIEPVDSQNEKMLNQSGGQPSTLQTDGINFSKTIASREDVEVAIDTICAYYKKFEPSSPLPILLLRAKKLVHLGFIEILKNMAPESLESVYKIGGITEDSEDNDN